MPASLRFIHSDRKALAVLRRGACYPEGHIECPSREDDLRHLAEKVELGTEFLISQLFFDNAFYFDFVQRAQAARIRVPIVPGIMPITSFEQVERFTRLCGATIPMRLRLQLERYQRDPEAILELGSHMRRFSAPSCFARGAPGFTFHAQQEPGDADDPDGAAFGGSLSGAVRTTNRVTGKILGAH